MCHIKNCSCSQFKEQWEADLNDTVRVILLGSQVLWISWNSGRVPYVLTKTPFLVYLHHDISHKQIRDEASIMASQYRLYHSDNISICCGCLCLYVFCFRFSAPLIFFSISWNPKEDSGENPAFLSSCKLHFRTTPSRFVPVCKLLSGHVIVLLPHPRIVLGACNTGIIHGVLHSPGYSRIWYGKGKKIHQCCQKVTHYFNSPYLIYFWNLFLDLAARERRNT